MLVRNLITGTSPSVIHRNGNPAEWERRWPQVVAEFFGGASRSSDACSELTIITWSTRPTKSLAERCLDRWGVSCVTLGRNLPEWRNDMKLYLNAKALERVESEYVMALDADDVLMVSEPRHILVAFRAFECDIVFGAEKNNWPPVRFLADFEEAIAESAYCYLNSGAWIGKTDACRRFFRDCLNEDDGDLLAAHLTRAVFRDDQGRTRKTFRRYHPAARLDYHCRIFQSLREVPPDGEVLIAAQTPDMLRVDLA
ncbi:MAG: hypothetical protein A3I61_09200 [Acidobacteria bacterium RIFCSPLOWO2_02_FULL_68_18]|nr:MAG: hypothetical protein A3I61_09200 [Acidobacteria bacterium RIFCSPLOWO2_02_FULL_68_18]OFW51117.1 MAG: hypothetical protein A3G77_15955 [Acidobacteria bacterium RIFCSPLOWO2_12_FULL_68_19]